MARFRGRRVFVTGIGLVTPLGCTMKATWSSLVTKPRAAGAQLFESGAERGLSQPVVVMRVAQAQMPIPAPPLLGRDVPPFTHFALAAAAEAMQDAGLPLRVRDEDAPRVGTSIGVGMAHIGDIVKSAELIEAGKHRRVSPFFVSRVLLNTAAGLVSQVHNLQGPNTAPATACAAGAHAILEGFYAIQRGDADAMIVGGAESAIEEVGLTGFMRARALSSAFADAPETASRPFDTQRDGFVMGEGAGVLILEEAEAARRRGVTHAYAELAGGGLSGDAWHVTSPPPCGGGARRAMIDALNSANVQPSEVDYVNAHATGTPIGDAIERRTIAKLFPASGESVTSGGPVVSSTKGAMGHLLGAAGAVEASVAALSVSNGIVPPTLNLQALDADAECEATGWSSIERYVPKDPLRRTVNVALSNSFGFGGTNASVVLLSPESMFKRRSVAT